MYSYDWDAQTGGILLNSSPLHFSKEPRPVYYKELDILGFDEYWKYEKNDAYPYMWAEANNYFYRGRLVAKTRGGALYTKPELIITDDPEPNGEPLRFVDIPAMVEKNRDLLEKLAQETIRKIYNIYIEFKQKVDIFHLSYSGGKDSEVAADLVQRALPHNAFVVIFGDTGMEFPDTYKAIDIAEESFRRLGVSFYRAKSHLSPTESWSVFGPPSSTIRWCCSVHKTAPQLMKLREIVGKNNFREMAFVGVRADESVRRSEYSFVSFGKKHRGQYSCNPILEWNSAEVYAYLYMNELPMNDAYKKGNSRAGCLVCPMSGDKADFFRQQCYPESMNTFMEIVKKMSIKELETPDDNKRYIELGGWKLRNNGRDIKSLPEKYIEHYDGCTTELNINCPTTDWTTWIKTIGSLRVLPNDQYIICKGQAQVSFVLVKKDNGYSVKIENSTDAKDMALTKMLKQVFRKSAYCILCRECEADCQKGCISMKNKNLIISDKCISCGNCHKPDTGCLLYKSLALPKGNGKLIGKSIDSYADHAPKIEWIQEFFKKKDDFFEDNSLGSVMISMFKRFLRDACLIENNQLTNTAKIIDEIGLDSPSSWAIMTVNLSYTPEINWYIKNTTPHMSYSREQLIEMLQQDGVKERGSKSVTGAYRRILRLPFGAEVGLGDLIESGKETTYIRGTWKTPDPLVILYSLYKFAEACGGYYQFTLSRLLDHDIDSSGVSPTQIFGLDRGVMEKLLNGLSINHPEYITAQFNLDLDTITLNADKKSEDILTLF